jgi:hypothetical protein
MGIWWDFSYKFMEIFSEWRAVPKKMPETAPKSLFSGVGRRTSPMWLRRKVRNQEIS